MAGRRSCLGWVIGLVLGTGACGGQSENAVADGSGGQSMQGGETGTGGASVIAAGSGGTLSVASTAAGGTTTTALSLKVVCMAEASKICREIYQDTDPTEAQLCGSDEQTLDTPCSLENALGYCQLSGLTDLPNYVHREYYYVGSMFNGSVLTGTDTTPMYDCERRSDQDWYSLP